MRLIFITDSHAKAKSPERRIDMFPMAILRKFLEISKVAEAIGADAIIHGGDLFDAPRVTPDYVGQLVEIIKLSDIPWYVVPGNHDLYGHTNKTINQTMFGLIARSGVINVLDRESPALLINNNITVSLQGQEYYAGIDTGIANDYDVEINPTVDFHILAAHGMLVDHEFVPGVNHTLIEDVSSNADIILAGHYHPGFDVQTHGNTTFINPGSIARTSASIDNDRLPKYVILDIDKNGIKYATREFKTALQADKVLDFSGKQQAVQVRTNIQQFKSLLQITSITKSNDMVQILSDIQNDPVNNVDASMVQSCLDKIAEVQLSKDDAVPKLDGYIPAQDKIFIQRIEAKNFMCYKDLDLELNSGLNVIRGESNSGKTTLLRLIRWVQYGEPRGSDFISHWASSTLGKITYSNGYVIERTRSKSSSGGVKIYDPHGSVVGDFKGVKDNPVDILNICQMPQIFITKDEKRNVAFADQLETSFLVTESPGFRASAIGRLTGLQDVDSSIRVINTENKSINKEIKVKEKLLTNATNELLKYKDIKQEAIRIQQTEQLIQKAKEIETEIKLLQTLQTQYTSIKNNIVDIESKIKSLSRLPNINLINQVEFYVKGIEEHINLKSSLENIRKDILDINKDLTIYKSMPNLNKHFDKAEKYLQEISKFNLLKNEYTKIMKDKQSILNSIDSGNKYIQDIDHDLDSMLGDHSLCPVCNQVVNKEQLLGG